MSANSDSFTLFTLIDKEGLKHYHDNLVDKLDERYAPISAESNQNAFGKVVVGTTTITADTEVDTLNIVAGDNVDITPDATNDKITISARDTTYGVVTGNAAGLMSADDKNKLDSITAGAEVNQNAFSNVVVGTTTIAAESKTDSLTIVAGDNVSITPDATNDKITISAKDTTYSFTNNAPTLSWGNTSTVGTVGGVNLTVKMPNNPNTDTKVTSVDNHYTPAKNDDAILTADASGSSTVASWGSTQLVTGVSLERDAKGHVTGVTVDSIKMPSNPNTDTHYITGINAGASQTTSNTSTTDPYITIKDNSTHRGQIQIKGAGATTVSSNTSGVITIDSTDTTYSNASQSSSGLMSSSDKTKLDNLHSVASSGNYNELINKPTSLKNPKALLVGAKSYDGSSEVSITAADLGLSSAMKYIGTSSSEITDGSTAASITIDGSSVAVSAGNVAIYGNKEFIWNGSKWEEFGNEGNYKVVQTAVPNPTAEGSTTAFIDTISQDTNGKITVTKKNVSFPTIPTLSGGSSTSNDATVVGGVTVSGHTVNVAKKTLTAGTNVTITGDTDSITISSKDTDTKVTSVDNHYTPTENADKLLSADASGSSTEASWGSTQLVTGVNLKRDAKGHVTGVTVDSIKMPSNPNTNSSHSHSAGVGLVGSGSSGTSGGTYTYKAKLKSETASTLDSASMGSTANRQYAVGVDKSGYLSVNVPWTDTNTNTTYSAGNGLTLSGTTFNVGAGTGLTVSADAISANLNSTTSLGTLGSTGKLYAVGVDSNGKLAVSVPWTDTNTTYSFTNNAPTLSWGNTSTIGTVGGVNLTVKMPSNPNTDTTYSAGSGLTLSGTTFNVGAGTGISVAADTVSVTYGTSAGTACQGNDDRLSNARPASDVYSWAKASTKPSYSFGEISAGNAVIGDGANSLFFRTNGSWASSIYHHTDSDEAVVFLNKGKNVNSTSNYTTSWIFAYGTPSERPSWTSLTPAMQIKGSSVVINKLLGSKVASSYNLDVNGSANATTLYENGTRVSLSGHNHDDRYYTESEIDNKLAEKQSIITNNVTYSGTLTSGQVAIFDGAAGKIKASGYTIAASVPSGAKFTDTTYSAATQSAAGLMSAVDKTKLDGIASGATAVSSSTVSGWGFTKNAGTVTSVATGTGLTGGTITSSGTISINSTYQGYITNGNNAWASVGTGSINSIPTGYKIVTVSATASGSFALQSTSAINGRDIHVLITNSGSSTITITLPTASPYVNLTRSSISIAAGGVGEINVLCANSKFYIRSAM